MRLLLACLAIYVQLSCNGEGPPTGPRASAEAGLVVIRSAVTEDNYGNMGFDSLAQVAVAELSEPFRVVLVDTVNWRIDLNSEVTEYDFPVRVGSRERLLIAVRKVDGVWQVTGFGGANFLQALVAVERDIPGPRDSTFVVRVPQLDDCFIARRGVGGLLLRPLFDNDGLHFVAGRPVQADSALASISQYCGRLREHNQRTGNPD